MNRSEKKTRPQRRERQLENAKKWEKWSVCWFTGEYGISANSAERRVSETLFIMQPFVQKSNPDDTIVPQAKIVNDFNAR